MLTSVGSGRLKITDTINNHDGEPPLYQVAQVLNGVININKKKKNRWNYLYALCLNVGWFPLFFLFFFYIFVILIILLFHLFITFPSPFHEIYAHYFILFN